MSLTDRQSAEMYSEPVKNAGVAPSALFAVDLVALDDETILTLRGELDPWTHRDLVTALAAVGDDVERLVLDLSALTFIDAASIGIIHQRRTLMEQRGGTLVLRSPNPEVRRILEVTGMISGAAGGGIQHRIVLPMLHRTYEHTPIGES